MTISATYYRASDATRARSISAFGSAGSGIMAAGTTGPSGVYGYLYSSASNNVTGLTVAGIQPQLGDMFVFSDSSEASGSWVVQSSGSVARFFGAMAGVLIPITTSMGYLNSGCSTAASGIFVMDYNGSISNYASAWTVVSTNAIPNTGPYHSLNYDGTSNLYCLSQYTVQKLALTNATSGTWSSMTQPFSGIYDLMFMNTTKPVVFGRIPITRTDVATDIFEDAPTSQILSLDSTIPQFTISVFDTYGNITTSTTLSMSGVPKYVDQATNQALVTDTTNGTLRVFNSSSGTWSGPVQTLTCTNAAKIHTSSDGTQAIVCQPASNSIQGFKFFAGSWSSVGTTSVSGASDVVLVSDTQAFVAGASGVSVMSLSSSWLLGITIPTEIHLNAIALDAYTSTMAYTCGTSAGSGFVYAVNTATSAISTQIYAGSGDDICFSNGYIAVLDNTNALIHTYSYVNGVLSGSSTFALPVGPTTWTRLRKGLIDRVYACSNAGWYVLRIKSPFTVSAYYQNVVAQWSGSAWTSGFFGFPLMTAGTTDGTNVYCFRYDNMMIKVNTSGVVQSGYPQTIPDYAGQNPRVPVGFSDAVLQNSTIYLSSALGGGICAVMGY